MKIEGLGTMSFPPDENTGELTCKLHDLSGNPLPYFVADEKFGKKFRGLGMIMEDLKNSERMLSKAIEKEFEEFSEIMWHIAVIGYGRCFVSAEGRGTCLELVNVKEAGLKHVETHNKVMEWRHQYVAHSGNNNEQLAVVLVPLHGDIENCAIGRPFNFRSRRSNPAKEELEVFLYLVRDLIQIVRKLGEKAETKLVEHYSSKSLEQRRNLFLGTTQL